MTFELKSHWEKSPRENEDYASTLAFWTAMVGIATSLIYSLIVGDFWTYFIGCALSLFIGLIIYYIRH